MTKIEFFTMSMMMTTTSIGSDDDHHPSSPLASDASRGGGARHVASHVQGHRSHLRQVELAIKDFEVNKKLRYESSTLILYKELSSPIFQSL